MYKEVKNPCKKCGSHQRYVSNNHCVNCLKEKQHIQGNKYAKKYREKHRDELSEKDKTEYRKIGKKYIYLMWSRAKKRAEQKGIPFTIKLDDIIIPDVCPVLNVSFSIGEGRGPGDFSPSLDRINGDIGYTKENVMIISFKANRIKNDATVEDVESVLKYMKNYMS